MISQLVLKGAISAEIIKSVIDKFRVKDTRVARIC